MIREDFYYSLFSESLKILLTKIAEKDGDIVATRLLSLEIAYNNPELNPSIKEVSSIKMLSYREKDGDFVISFLPIGKHPEFSENNKWSKKNRQECKIGRAVLALLTCYSKFNFDFIPTTKEIEVFVNRFKSLLTDDNIEVQIVRGDDIRKYYHHVNNYQTSNGGATLFSSCMRHDSCQSFFDIYTTTKACEMVIIFDKNLSTDKIVGRALLWTAADGNKYLDRRYYCTDVYEQVLINFAKANNFGYKSLNTYDDGYSKLFMVPVKINDDEIRYQEESIEITVETVGNFTKFPYADSVKYYSKTRNILSNCKIKGSSRLGNTDGRAIPFSFWGGDYEEQCSCCGNNFRISQMIMQSDGTHVCRNCSIEDYFGQFCPESMLTKVYYNNGGYAYFNNTDINEYALEFRGKYYMLPTITGMSSIYRRTPENEIDTNYEIINETYVINLQQL